MKGRGFFFSSQVKRAVPKEIIYKNAVSAGHYGTCLHLSVLKLKQVASCEFDVSGV